MKECYGLDIPIKGKPKWIYENPYNYIEKLGYQPIEDMFDVGYVLGPDEHLFLHHTNSKYFLLFYAKSKAKNDLADRFCNAFVPYKNNEIYSNMIIAIPDGGVDKFKFIDKKELNQLLKDCYKWFGV